MSSDRDTVWWEVVPVGGTPWRADRAHDKSCGCRELLLIFVHIIRMFSDIDMLTHVMSAEKQVGDENGSMNRDNGNEKIKGPAKWRGAHDK